MKKYIVFLLICILILLPACQKKQDTKSPQDDGVLYGATQITVYHIDRKENISGLSNEAKDYFLSLWNSNEWESDNTKTVSEYVFELGEDTRIVYSTESGIFNDTENKRHLLVTSEQKDHIKSLLESVVLKPESTDPNPAISIHSLEDLDKMRNMVNCPDDEELLSYLLGIEGGGATSREDLKEFIELVDSIPYAPLIHGDITWICRSWGESADNGKPFSVLCVTTQAENGEWFRIEYDLLTFGKSEFIADRISQISATSGMLSKPVQSADKKIRVYAEETKTYNTGETSVIWSADINGVFARIFYSSVGAGVNAESVFTDVSVSNIRSLCNNSAD